MLSCLGYTATNSLIENKVAFYSFLDSSGLPDAFVIVPIKVLFKKFLKCALLDFSATASVVSQNYFHQISIK